MTIKPILNIQLKWISPKCNWTRLSPTLTATNAKKASGPWLSGKHSEKKLEKKLKKMTRSKIQHIGELDITKYQSAGKSPSNRWERERRQRSTAHQNLSTAHLMSPMMSTISILEENTNLKYWSAAITQLTFSLRILKETLVFTSSRQVTMDRVLIWLSR